MKCTFFQVAVISDGNYVRGSGSVEVTVSVPPSRVELRANGQPIPGDILRVEKDDSAVEGGDAGDDKKQNPTKISCVAQQARPAPEFQWFIGNQEIFVRC